MKRAKRYAEPRTTQSDLIGCLILPCLMVGGIALVLMLDLSFGWTFVLGLVAIIGPQIAVPYLIEKWKMEKWKKGSRR